MNTQRRQLVDICNSCCRIECVDYEFDDLRPDRVYDHSMVSGSGFLVEAHSIPCVSTLGAHKYVVTNFHVVDGCRGNHQVMVYFPSLGKNGIRGFVVRAFPQVDLAIIRLDHTDTLLDGAIEALPITYDVVPTFTKAYALGYPMASNDVQVSEGTVSGWDEEHIQLNISINDGNSGGPIVVQCGDGTLKVAAVTVATAGGAEGIAYGIPLLFFNLYQSCLYRRSSSILGLFPETLCSTRGPFITTGHERDILMIMGFKVGDKVIRVNGAMSVDDFGEVPVFWRQKVSWIDKHLLFTYITQGGHATVDRGGKITIVEWPPLPTVRPALIRHIFPAYECPVDRTIGAITITNLNMAVVHSACQVSLFQHSLSTYITQPTKRHESAIVVAHIDINSATHASKIIEVYDIVTHINGLRVSSLADIGSTPTHSITINESITILSSALI